LIHFFVSPFQVLILHQSAIEAFVRRDIRARYVTSVMGLSWAIIQPFTLLLLYTFVFSYVLKIRLGGSATAGSFATYLFCGMLPWMAFAEGVTRSSSVILDHSHLIKKVVFPSDILPAYVVLSALAIELVGLAIFLPAIGLFGSGLAWPALLLPVIILCQFLFTLGLGWLLASLTVFLRDVGQLLGLAMTLWLFLTPIFYPDEMVPAQFRWLLELNPLYYIVESYRDLLLEHRLPDLRRLLVLAGLSAASFLFGHWFFRRSRRAFVDVL